MLDKTLIRRRRHRRHIASFPATACLRPRCGLRASVPLLLPVGVFGLIEVSPTIKAAAGTFGVSVPYVQEAIADLKDVGHLPKRNGNGHGNDYAVVHDYAKLPFIPDASDLWSHMTDGEREAFVRGHLLSVWDAVERVTA